MPPVAEVFTMPAVTEPLIVWISSGQVETQEREDDRPWLISHVKEDSLFLTAAGAPYDFSRRTLTSEPFEAVLVLLGLPLFNEALQDVFGANAVYARLRDASGFEDQNLISNPSHFAQLLNHSHLHTRDIPSTEAGRHFFC